MNKFQADYDRARNLLDRLDGMSKYDVVGSALYREDAQDLDLVVLTMPEPGDFIDRQLDGWKFCGEYDTDGRWIAVRAGNVNLIVTNDEDFFEKMVTSAHVCAALELETKRERMIVHRVIRDDMDFAEARDTVDKELEPLDLE